MRATSRKSGAALLGLLMALGAASQAAADPLPRGPSGMPNDAERFYDELLGDLAPLLPDAPGLRAALAAALAGASHDPRQVPEGERLSDAVRAELFGLAREQAQFAASIVGAAGQPKDAAAALAIAQQLLVARAGLTGRIAAAQGASLVDLSELVDAQAASMALAQDLLALAGGHPGDLATAVAMAQRVNDAQAALLGVAGSPAPAGPGHARPSDAVLDLAARYQASVDGADLTRVRALDDVPEPARGALRAFLDAFLAFDQAARDAYAGADHVAMNNRAAEVTRSSAEAMDYLRGLPPGVTPWADMVAVSGIQPGPMLSARAALLDQVVPLRDALALLNPLLLPLPLRTCAPVQVFVDATFDGVVIPVPNVLPDPGDPWHGPDERIPAFTTDGEPWEPPESIVIPGFQVHVGVFSIELSGCATTYDEDFRLAIDAGGRDLWRNNAGGTGAQRWEGVCTLPTNYLAGPSAAFDFDGDDTYHVERNCGIQGGGYGHAALLVDAWGNDAYRATTNAVMGGAAVGGFGMLIDAAGSDTYGTEADTGGGVQGGAYVGGAGHLLDMAGNDAYRNRGTSATGGAQLGLGFQVDVGGNDQYLAGTHGANGGATLGLGFLLDTAGNDVYRARATGTNGGSALGGVALLVDGAGSDLYDATVQYASLSSTNGGSTIGVGGLVDGSGDDVYTTDAHVANGGSMGSMLCVLDCYATFPIPSLGMLVDGDGLDSYTGPGGAVNGGGILYGAGSLVDLGGKDAYAAGSTAVNGGASFAGVGFLLDREGDDAYTAGSEGTNGGAWGLTSALYTPFIFPAVGTLVDAGGHDTYGAASDGANGGAQTGVGVLVDAGGDDAFTAGSGGANGGGSVQSAGTGVALVDGAVGALIDAFGTDTYAADATGANGAGNSATGLLLDGGGPGDQYSDAEGGSGTDKTVVPKGNFGAQVDVQ